MRGKGRLILKKNLFITGLLFFSLSSVAQFSATEDQKVVSSDRAVSDYFGSNLSISGDYLVVGSYYEDEDENGANTKSAAGAAYVFERDGGTWSEVQKIVASDRASTDYFGVSVSISGDYLVVGAYLEDEDENGANTKSSAGAAYVFERDGGGSWNEVQKIVASDRAVSDNFGRYVSISGDYLVVGAYLEDEDENGANTLTDVGSAYIFERDGGGTWNEVQKIVSSDRAANDRFGLSLSISGDYLVVGAFGEDEDENGANFSSSAGSAYVFERDGGGTWNEVQKIVSSDRASNDFFGGSVSISGDYLVVGAYGEDHDENGANIKSGAGSAYVFERDGGGTWNEAQKIVASDRANDDDFGENVSISGTFLVIGASEEDQDENGANTLSKAGSAYVFERDGGTWGEVQKIVASDRAVDDEFSFSVSISGNYIAVGAPYEDEDENGANTLSAAGSAYIYENSVVLPVELLSFDVECELEYHELSWLTASELNNDHFILESSFDGIEFNFLTQVQGNGTTSELNHYSFKHKLFSEKISYYRLTQVDYNGQVKTYPLITSYCTLQYDSLEIIYLNSQNGYLNLASTIGKDKFYKVKIVDVAGKVIYCNEHFSEEKLAKDRISLHNHSKGIYFVTVIAGSNMVSEKLLIK